MDTLLHLHEYTIYKYITKQDIQLLVENIANQINKDYHGKEIVLLGILNGCIMFYSDLLKYIRIPCQVQFIQLSSYKGTSSTGIIEEISTSNYDFTNKHVIIVEDIVDTGLTMKHMIDSLQHTASLEIATLLFKKKNFSQEYTIKYIGKEIENKFVIGYGMDLDGYYRNFNELYYLVPK